MIDWKNITQPHWDLRLTLGAAVSKVWEILRGSRRYRKVYWMPKTDSRFRLWRVIKAWLTERILHSHTERFASDSPLIGLYSRWFSLGPKTGVCGINSKSKCHQYRCQGTFRLQQIVAYQIGKLYIGIRCYHLLDHQNTYWWNNSEFHYLPCTVSQWLK